MAEIFAGAGIEPAPEWEKKRTWKQFIEAHWDLLYGGDFFAVEALGLGGTVLYLVLFVISLKTRAVKIAGIRVNPDGEWMKQLARNLTDPVDGFLRHAQRERFHQGLGGQLIEKRASSAAEKRTSAKVVCRPRLGGILNFYEREAP